MGVLKASIVLTGGPCAGKTTTIVRVKEYLESIGYHVLLLNECATEIINGGMRPFGNNAISVFDFQDEVLNLQIYKENRYNNIIKKLPEDAKCIILADRGLLDSKAYLGDVAFKDLLNQNNLDENELIKRYDMVIHMVTVATDIKNKYNNSTNTARFEEADEAIDLDKRTSEVWKKHHNFKIVEATEVIDEKISNVISLVNEFINNKY